jgi:hypothetical protein
MADMNYFAGGRIADLPESFLQHDTSGNNLWNPSISRANSPIGGSDPRWAGWNKKLERPFMFDRYDTIQITTEEASRMSQIDIDPILELAEKPALSEFSLKVITPKETRSICFRKTILPQDGIVCMDETDGTHKTVYPLVDAYISMNGGKTVDWVINIAYCISDEEAMTFNWPIWARIRGSLNHPMMPTITSETNAFYWLLQRLCRDRPAIFMTASTRRVTESSSKRKVSGKRNKVKTVRVIYVDTEELRSYCDQEKVRREITCPAWGVIGHWRNYKSGKRVWIEPYRKGKQRHDPKAYIAKDYEVVTDKI